VLFSTIYVDINSPGPVRDGASWATAFVDLQQALGAATAGDEIRVADGTYKPTLADGRHVTFRLKNHVRMLGGFGGYGTVPENLRDVSAFQTILSGDIGAAGNSFDNSYRVITSTGVAADTVLDGFTVAYGNANGVSADSGAGIYNDDSSTPTISNCTFKDNAASFAGGAIYNRLSSPTIVQSKFIGNTAPSYGGAIFNESASPVVTDCTFMLNSAMIGFGGAVHNGGGSPKIIGCSFFQNSADSGGAMHNFSTNPLVSGCTFVENVADGTGVAGLGGAIYNETASPTIRGCNFSDNEAARWGGGVSTSAGAPSIIECTFYSNEAFSGAAVYAAPSTSVTVRDCDFVENTVTTLSGAGGAIYTRSSSMTLDGCDFLRNFAGTGGGAAGGAVSNSSASPTIRNCTFYGNSATFGGAISNSASSPLIVNCNFTGNTARDGGAIFTNGSGVESLATIVNCTFSSNFATFRGGAIENSSASMSLKNSILWSNSSPEAPQIYQLFPDPTVSFCDIQGGWAGLGNVDSNPQFQRNSNPGTDTAWGTTDDDYGDLRLQSSSACLDAGSNAAIPSGVTTDFDGNPRLADFPGVNDAGAIVDMGPYERVATGPTVTAEFLFETVQQVRLQFSSNIAQTLSLTDLQIQNLTTAQSVAPQSLAQSSGATEATWSFDSILPDGNYRATLPGGSVADTYGNPLAADFTLDFFILAGDANHDRKVDVADLGILATNWQQSPRTFAQGDFDYSGTVDVNDLGILASHWQQLLAPVSAAALRRTPSRLIQQLTI
jgi:hypothetical protein